MDHRLKARIGLVASHGDAFELLQLAKEVLDQMAPFVGRWLMAPLIPIQERIEKEDRATGSKFTKRLTSACLTIEV